MTVKRILVVDYPESVSFIFYQSFQWLTFLVHPLNTSISKENNSLTYVEIRYFLFRVFVFFSPVDCAPFQLTRALISTARFLFPALQCWFVLGFDVASSLRSLGAAHRVTKRLLVMNF